MKFFPSSALLQLEYNKVKDLLALHCRTEYAKDKATNLRIHTKKEFIEKELQPYIEKKYRTTTSKTIIGESLGGLLATEILIKKPTLFSKYIIVSPSLWWDNGSLLNQASDILQDNFPQKTDIYIGCGKEGLGPSDIPHVMEVDANLLAEKIKNSKSKSVNVYFDYLPQEDHATIEHQAVYNAFRIFHSTTTDY